MSGYPDEVVHVGGWSDDPIIAKPFEERTFLAQVRKALDPR